MNIFIDFILKLYSDIIEICENFHKNVKNIPYYIFIINLFKKAHNYVFEYHTDPDLPFSSEMYLNKNLDLMVSYNTDIYKPKKDNYDYKLILNKFNFKDNDYIQTKLIKYNENYIIDSNTDHISKSDNSKFKFLAVQYIHPDIKGSLSLVLDKSYLSIGNDIFDNIFVKYFLSKHFKKDEYVFDEKYTINIMSDDCKFFALDYNSYIHFNDDKWIIKKKDKQINIQN